MMILKKNLQKKTFIQTNKEKNFWKNKKIEDEKKYENKINYMTKLNKMKNNYLKKK